MRPSTARLSLILLLAGTAHAAGSDRLRVAPRPAWVVPADVPEGPAPGVETEGGVEYLLLDDQVRVGAGQVEAYARRVRRITSIDGIDHESQFDLDWDPAYETLVLHRLVIWRDGRELDRLDLSKIRVAQREESFEANLLDGSLSALIVLDDVRVGDVVEHEFTMSGVNPVFGTRYSGGFSASWGVPIARLRYRLLWPPGRPLGVQPFDIDIEPRRQSVDGFDEYTWERDDLPPVDDEGDEPEWTDLEGFVQLSEWETWNDVARWAVPLYAPPKRPDAEVAALIERFRAESPTDAGRAVVALRFVQDEIRYLGLELGAGSHEPTAPEVVLARRFGDCKDKTRLLGTLLSGLGLSARPALVNSSHGAQLDRFQPSPSAFDHVITLLALDGHSYWLDATQSHQRGTLDRLVTPRFGLALVVDDATEDLLAILPPPGDEPLTDIVMRLDVPEPEGVAELNVTTTYRGDDADTVRSVVALGSRAGLRRDYLNYYARQWPGIATEDEISIDDDEDANEIVTRESYSIEDFWKPSPDGTSWIGFLQAPEIEDQLAEPDTTVRARPLAIDHPKHVTFRCVAQLPSDFDIDDMSEVIEDAGARWRMRVTHEARVVTLEHEWQTLTDWLPAEEARRHVRDLRRAYEHTGYQLELPADEPMPAHPAARGVGSRATSPVNWGALAVALLGAALATSIGLTVLAWPVPHRDVAASDAPSPLPRWLVLFVLMAPPLGLAAAGCAAWRQLSPAWWDLARGGEATLHVLVQPLMLLELALLSIACVLDCWLVLGCFSRKRGFPAAFLVARLVSAGALLPAAAIAAILDDASPAMLPIAAGLALASLAGFIVLAIAPAARAAFDR